MAKLPDIVVTGGEPKQPKRGQKRDAEQDMLMREVDEAVRQDDVSTFARKYGLLLGGLFAVLLLGFGAYLWFDGRSEASMEDGSERFVQATDQLEAGNEDAGDEQLAALAEEEGGIAALAKMQRAAIALRQDRRADAIALYDEVAADGDLPAQLRDMATIRSVSAGYDEMSPDDVIARLGSIANADNPLYGSAAELLAFAYLDKGEREQAGTIFAAIARSQDAPLSLRNRARSQAGYLGVDAIEDVDAALAEITGEELDGAAVQLVE